MRSVSIMLAFEGWTQPETLVTKDNGAHCTTDVTPGEGQGVEQDHSQLVVVDTPSELGRIMNKHRECLECDKHYN